MKKPIFILLILTVAAFLVSFTLYKATSLTGGVLVPKTALPVEIVQLVSTAIKTAANVESAVERIVIFPLLVVSKF